MRLVEFHLQGREGGREEREGGKVRERERGGRKSIKHCRHDSQLNKEHLPPLSEAVQ